VLLDVRTMGDDEFAMAAEALARSR
jgi:hypothetical protein